jgi:hypothetical protein
LELRYLSKSVEVLKPLPTMIEEAMVTCMVNHFLVTGVLNPAALVRRKVPQV